MLGPAEIPKLVPGLSLGAVTYQARVLLDELGLVASSEYQREAQVIRDVLISITRFILEELWRLRDPNDPLAPPTDSDTVRIQELGRIVHRIYATLNYLRASTHLQAPPAIQVALKQLSDRFFPKKATPLNALVIPQWNYNLSYISLTSILKTNVVRPSILDPDKRMGTSDPEALLRALCARANLSGLPRGKPPPQLAIVSFAGLDTNDALLFPLLAHELGHAIDLSSAPPIHGSPEVRQEAQISLNDIELEFPNLSPREAARKFEELNKKIEICLRELLADILAARMSGFGFFVAQAEFLKTVAGPRQANITDTGYPGLSRRLSVVLEHLSAKDFPGNPEVFLSSTRIGHEDVADWLLSYIGEWRRHLGSIRPRPLGSLLEIADRAIERAIPKLHEAARAVVPDSQVPKLSNQFFERIEHLRADLPPSLNYERPDSFAEIMAAGWAFQLMYGEEREISHPDLDGCFREYSKTCRLVQKATELFPACRSRTKRPSGPVADRRSRTKDSPSGGGVLSAPEIRRRLELPVTDHQKISVSPTVADLVNGASLDVRLGNWFAMARRSKLSVVDLQKPEARLLTTPVAREEVFVPAGDKFTIHPGDFVLGATLEFVGLPSDIMAFVEGKSGIGRRGLLVATATQIAPGFRGVVVLELANTGIIPLELSPGMPIAQLVFLSLSSKISDEDLYKGTFQCQIKP